MIAAEAVSGMIWRRSLSLDRSLRSCIWILAALLLAALLPGRGWKRPVTSDGYYYYIWLRSIWNDHDLDLTNDYRSTGNPYSFSTTSTGRPDNVFPVGSAVLWAPFFAFEKLGERLLQTDQDPLVMTVGEQRSVAVGTLFYGLLGMLLLYKVCRRIGAPTASLLSIMATLWGTFLAYYLTTKPSMSEGCSFFSQALALFVVSGTRENSSRLRYFCCGAAIGLSTAVRYHNLASVGLMLAILPASWQKGIRPTLAACTAATAGFVLGFSPQTCVLLKLYGSPLTLGTAQSFVAPNGINLLSTLLSPYHGLFYFHPIALIGLAGMIARLSSAGREKWESRAVLLAFMLHALAVSIGADIGAAFGARKFSGSLPLLATGMTYIMALALTRGAVIYRTAAVVLTLAAVSWNLLLWHSLGSTLSARESASVSAVIAGAPEGRDAPRMRTVYFGRGSIPAGVLEGWGDVESDAGISYRRLAADRGELRLILPKSGELDCKLRARSFGTEPIRTRLAIGRTWSTEVQIGSHWEDHEFRVRVPGETGPARLVFTVSAQRRTAADAVQHVELAVAWISFARVAPAQ